VETLLRSVEAPRDQRQIYVKLLLSPALTLAPRLHVRVMTGHEK